MLNDFVRGLPGLPGTFHDALGELLRSPDYLHLERMIVRLRDQISPHRSFPAISDAVPTGLMTNAPLERWLRQNLEKIDVPNRFGAFSSQRGRALYIAACELDTAERVIFGADEFNGATISEAVQASTALPLFYKPARIGGIDYVDGGVRNTANIDVAIEKGADLVICYNPFRPIWNQPLPEQPRLRERESAPGGSVSQALEHTDGRRIADQGLKGVLNQVFRTLLQSRLRLGLERYRDHSYFDGDIVLLEPKEHDLDFFSLNPMAFWKRDAAMRHGYQSVRHTVDHRFDELEQVFEQYGLRMSQAVASRRAAAVVRERGWTVPANQRPWARASGRAV